MDIIAVILPTSVLILNNDIGGISLLLKDSTTFSDWKLYENGPRVTKVRIDIITQYRYPGTVYTLRQNLTKT